MKIYTKTGDDGTTGLIGSRVSKGDIIIEAIGQIDLVNAHLGYLYELAKTFKKKVPSFQRISNQLFTVGSQLADTKGNLKIKLITETEILELEKEIDQMTEQLPELKNFILPMGNSLAAYCHIIRAQVRSAERTCSKLEDLPEHILPYLNRLSDYFFTFARFFVYLNEDVEIIWDAPK